MSSGFNTRISVVVLTYNRVDRVLDTLQRLSSLPERPRIVVADNGSRDETVSMIRMLFPDVQVVQCGLNLGAAGRNRAVACVDTDYVAFCDDDTWWEPGSLAHAINVLDQYPNVGVLNACVKVGETGEIDTTCLLMQHSPLHSRDLPGPSLIGYMAGACVFRTSVFRETGGYDERLFIGGEEALVALDVLARGRAIVYCNALTVAHHPSAARDSLLRRRMLARNAAWVAWLRLPLREALGATARAFAAFSRERTLWADGCATLRGLLWTTRERKRIPAHVVSMRDAVREHERGLTFQPAPAPTLASSVVPEDQSRVPETAGR